MEKSKGFYRFEGLYHFHFYTEFISISIITNFLNKYHFIPTTVTDNPSPSPLSKNIPDLTLIKAHVFSYHLPSFQQNL